MLFTCLFIAFKGKVREIRLDENFFTGYRKTILEQTEVLVNILIPFTKKVTILVPVPFIIRFSDTRRWAKCNL